MQPVFQAAALPFFPLRASSIVEQNDFMCGIMVAITLALSHNAAQAANYAGSENTNPRSVDRGCGSRNTKSRGRAKQSDQVGGALWEL